MSTTTTPNANKFSGAPMGGNTSSTPVSSQATTTTTTSCSAIASLVCGILAFFILGVVLGPVAICLAVSAKNEIQESNGQVKGECMATSGMILGIIGMVLSIIWIIVIVSSN